MSCLRKQSKKTKKNAFGATAPPFIDYLKEILRRYPDGGQILKELIQNADDAGASKAVFIHDERRYGTNSLFSEPLGKYQGPALYAFNDAVFTEEDWEGIQRAGRSIKQEDPTKVGRFGIGFNSVYHVTDLPCVFSSKHLAVFDPQKQMFDDEREGYRWSLNDADDRSDLLEFTDQFKPFSDAVKLACQTDWEKIINEQHFRGTLFRFPLRNEVSEISDNLYDSEKVTQLFDSFIPDADVSLLFLRNVSSISLIHVDSSGNVNVRVKVSSQSRPPPLSEANNFQRQNLQGKTCFKTMSCVSPGQKETKTEWLLTSCKLKDGNVPDIDELAAKLSFYPQVDVAFQCDGKNTHSTGRLSCFLPLPNNETNKTGLPVHINACFGLTDNRRHIKWQDEDQKNDESAKWNELLIKDVLPHVYLLIILDAIQLSKSSALPASSVYNLWPDLSNTKYRPRWHNVARDVFKQLYHQEIFSLTKNEKIWVDSSKAIFPADSSDPDTMPAVIRLLIERGENLVLVPEHVLIAIKSFPNSSSLKKVTPGFVRAVLHHNNIQSIQKVDRLSLLEYVLSDGQYGELNGLQLLPLNDGSFRSFTNKHEKTALIDNEKFSRLLLPFCNERFLPADLKRSIVAHLRQMAQTNSGLYKLINLDAQNVAALAKENLPRDWKETQGHVTLNWAKENHPPKTWLKEFWTFLNTHWADLRNFIGMPLIPLEPIQNASSVIVLARLESKPRLIFQSSRASILSNEIQNVIKVVGGTVIRKDECLRHHDIERYILMPSPKNVLQILLNCDRHQVISGITSLTAKEEFKMYISCLDCLSDTEKNLLSVLPVFRLLSGKYVSSKSKKAVILKSNPPIPLDLPVPDTIIQCANEADRRILTLLKVDLLDAAQLAIHLVDCIERRSFQKVDEQKIMTWILNHGNLLFSQNAELLKKTKNLSFILTDRGECRRPSDVFDPTSKVFLDLFEDEFPPQIYRTPVMLESLRQLGLKTKESDLSSTNICHVASQVQKLNIHSGKEALKKADVLIKVLNRNDLLSRFSQEEIRELLNLQWVPCDNPDSFKSKQKRGLFKPNEVRASKYSQIVGHVMPLTSELSERFCHKLGLSRTPPAEKVLENLRVLTLFPSQMGTQDSDDKFKKKLHSTYKFMQENIKDFRSLMSERSFPWIWCQTEFVLPQQVVMNYPAELDLSPYIKKVPEEFLKYAVLLEEFGVKKVFPVEHIESILHKIKERIDARNPHCGTSSELKVSIAILDWMRKNQMRLRDGTPVPVRAPDQRFTLQAWEDTVFCDISDEGLDDLRQDKEIFHVIHEEVLPVTAKWLQIPFLSTRILKPQVIEYDEAFEGIEQCGQSEPITQRIKNILKEYDEESDIFKELIQNAEDAGASSCGFLLDFREHPSEGLIDEGMASCNGPCLWAFNNELFSEEDWKNIVRVGAASKESKIEKIGKFGLGFNAVYHLTDIPSILSGQHLLILDPNVIHLKKHIKNITNPGIKLTLFQERLFRRFPGQFKPYQGIFDCDLSKSNQNNYNGTLIKLPFRTIENSEISSKVYNKERINAFQQQFTENSQTPLLFLKHINSLTLQSISNEASTPPKKEQNKTLLKISREVVSPIKISEEMHLQNIRNTLENLDPKYHEIVDSFSAHIDKIVCERADGSAHQYWLIYSCLGAKDSMHMFQAEAKQCSFSLPIGGVAVPLQRESETIWAPDQSCTVGQAFCFLPLPIKTGLPVHINGSFAVTSNRKALWANGPKLEWNKALLQDAVATAYITTLLELKKMEKNKELQNYSYFTFWPDVEKANKAFQPLVEAFYSVIVQNTEVPSLELFSNNQTWCSFSKARFLDPNIQGNKAVGKFATHVFLKYADPSYCPILLPNWVRNNFNKCGFSKMLNERTFHWAEFYQVVFKNLNQIDPHSRNALILNALDLNNGLVDDLLKIHPCIPVQKVGTLQYISKVVHPQGKVACLYEPEEGHFLDSTQKEYFTPKRIQRLLDLGMMSDSLTLEEVIERVKTIPRVWGKDKTQAYRRLSCLFDCMRQNSDVKSPHWETLKRRSFLPAVGINHHNTEVTVLKKPSEVYSACCYDLVSLTEHTVTEELDISLNKPVLTKLGVNKNPSVETVLKQLKEAHDRSDALDKSVLLRMANSCYDHLNQHLLNDGDPTAISECAGSVPFVFIDDHFVNVQSVALSGVFEEKPYLHILPQIFSKFQNLWTCVGIKSLFTTDQFVGALQKISALHYGPLPQKELNICLSILNKGLYEAEDENIKYCLLPDERGMLTISSKLYYNDSPWMPVESDVTLCHKLISRALACRFGVTTTRHHTLKKNLIQDFSPFVEEFGQHEKLTVRIKNIIDSYPAKKDILKELIQNADDAEATEIHFIWDKRKHRTEKIFGEKWELLQGPALCVYNNKKFTNEDLSGIQQVGEGGKHGTLGRTGKYGLGFNSVYQLTDCPSLITGDEHLCIFDPNLQYVEVATKEAPGCKYSLDEQLKESFKDIYSTFLPDKYQLDSGTMFRFPLRTEEMANKSEISRNPVKDEEILELFRFLQADPEEFVLFLKYIKKIRFDEIEIDGRVTNHCLIEKQITKETMEEREGFQSHVRSSYSSDTIIPYQAIYKARITSGKDESLWVIAERYGSYTQSHEKRGNSIVPQAALATCLGRKSKKQFKGKTFCCLPLPGETNLPVHVNGNFELDSSRRDLWKEDAESVKTKWNQLLKQNTIAPLYADLLTHLCAKFKKGNPNNLVSLKSHLNFCLDFFPVVSKCDKVWYEMINEVYRSINERSLPVIPTVRRAADGSSHLKDPKYTINWSSLSKPDPVDSPHFTTYDQDNMIVILEHIGMDLVPSSPMLKDIQKGFKTAGVKVAEISSSSVMNYLKKKPLNDPSQTTADLPLPVNQTLIRDAKCCRELLKFCLSNDERRTYLTSSKEKEKCSSVDLNGLPLLLTQDQVLRKFSSDSPRLISKFANIFLEHQSEFADFSVNEDYFKMLEHGRYIKKLTIQVAAKFLKPVLRKQLQHLTPDERNGLYAAEKETLQSLRKLWEFFDDQVKHESHVTETNQAFSEIKEHFSNSHVVPVIYPNQKDRCFLQTIEKLHSIIKDPTEHISPILIKLGFMILESTFFLRLSEFKVNYVRPELLNIGDTSAVLKQLIQVPHAQFGELSDKDADELQVALQIGLTSSQKNTEDHRMFKSLPLFETVSGKRQRIDLHSNVFVLNTKYQESFPELYKFDENKGIFLKYKLLNENLSKILDIKIMEDLEYCVQFVLPLVHALSETQLLDLVSLLVIMSSERDYEQYRSRISSTLRDVKFIRDIHGQLQTASHFYDDGVDLYKVMLPDERFVPKAFWNRIRNFKLNPFHYVHQKRFLKDLGMKHEVSEEEIVQFARQIESDARGNTELDVLRKRSSVLLETALYKYNDNGKTSNLMKKIADIKFLFPVQIKSELSDYHKAYAEERDTVAIRGSLLEKDPDHQYLMWTSMPILATNYFNSQSLMLAGACDKPPSERVVANLQNICTTPCKNEKLVETRAAVFRKSYAFLQSVTFEESVLVDLPVVLVENDVSLVKASQTVLSLLHPEEFRPYLYPIQAKDAMYAEFFRKVGVMESPTIIQVCTVLQEIYTECLNKTALQPNQQTTVQRAVHQLFCLLDTKPEGDHFQNNTLYLPSTDGKLYESSTLFFNDTCFQAKRLSEALKSKLNLLEKLSYCHLDTDPYEHQRLLQLLPESSRPKMLSQVISLRLVGAQLEDCDYGTACEFSSEFQKRMFSPALRHGLICLIREQKQGSVTQDETEKMCENTFGKLRIVCSKALNTQLYLEEEPLEGTETETQVYVKNQQDECVLYLRHNDNTNYKVLNDVNMNLTREINSLLGNILNSSSLLVLGQLLVCDNMTEVEKILEERGIKNTASEEGGFGARPSPGSLIPEEWHDCLDMDPLNSFEKGEYVGYSMDDSENEYYYAIVVERLDDQPGQSRRHPARYQIQIGNDVFIEVSSLDLYQFKRENQSAPVTDATCTDLAIFSGAVPSRERTRERAVPQTLEEAKKDIDQSLNEIWKMSETDKQKAIKRLYLKWHPDKNPDNKDLATEAFKYLQNRIKDLESGRTQKSSSYSGFDFSDFFNQWNSQARSHRRGRERFYRNNSRRRYNFWSFFTETPRPDKEEARRWFKQAKCDLSAAKNESEYERSPEWSLFKVHQAVEKALIAIEFRRSGRRPETGSNIMGLAYQISHYAAYLRDVPHIVNKLRLLGVDAKKTQYPTYHPKPHIPHDQFRSEDAQRAVSIATELLETLNRYVTD